MSALADPRSRDEVDEQPEEAREAGRKGGMVVSQNRDHMAAIGREGGKK